MWWRKQTWIFLDFCIGNKMHFPTTVRPDKIIVQARYIRPVLGSVTGSVVLLFILPFCIRYVYGSHIGKGELLWCVVLSFGVLNQCWHSTLVRNLTPSINNRNKPNPRDYAVVGSRRLMPPAYCEPAPPGVSHVTTTLEAPVARNGRQILAENSGLHASFRDLLHAANLRHGTDGFTSLPKEGVLRIFSPWKSPASNPRCWVPKASTLPLDHRSRKLDICFSADTWFRNGGWSISDRIWEKWQVCPKL